MFYWQKQNPLIGKYWDPDNFWSLFGDLRADGDGVHHMVGLEDKPCWWFFFCQNCWVTCSYSTLTDTDFHTCSLEGDDSERITHRLWRVLRCWWTTEGLSTKSYICSGDTVVGITCHRCHSASIHVEFVVRPGPKTYENHTFRFHRNYISRC